MLSKSNIFAQEIHFIQTQRKIAINYESYFRTQKLKRNSNFRKSNCPRYAFKRHAVVLDHKNVL